MEPALKALSVLQEAGPGRGLRRSSNAYAVGTCCLLDTGPGAAAGTEVRKTQPLLSRSSLSCQEDQMGTKITVSKLECGKCHRRGKNPGDGGSEGCYGDCAVGIPSKGSA